MGFFQGFLSIIFQNIFKVRKLQLMRTPSSKSMVILKKLLKAPNFVKKIVLASKQVIFERQERKKSSKEHDSVTRMYLILPPSNSPPSILPPFLTPHQFFPV